jgi:two-component system nitrate/nitrite response regulator NarL
MKVDALTRAEHGEPCAPHCGVGCGCMTSALRGLLQHIEAVGIGLDTEEILLDTDVDGSRYLLVRVPKSAQPVATLSPREQEIARMVSRGCPNKVIADVLNISPWTVCTHLRRIFAKLGVTTRAAMVARMLDVRASRVT